MYKLQYDPLSQSINIIHRLADNAFIPLSLDNIDYVKFKKEVLEGVELQDADGNVMTAEAAQEFVKELP